MCCAFHSSPDLIVNAIAILLSFVKHGVMHSKNTKSEWLSHMPDFSGQLSTPQLSCLTVGLKLSLKLRTVDMLFKKVSTGSGLQILVSKQPRSTIYLKREGGVVIALKGQGFACHLTIMCWRVLSLVRQSRQLWLSFNQNLQVLNYHWPMNAKS